MTNGCLSTNVNEDVRTWLQFGRELESDDLV